MKTNPIRPDPRRARGFTLVELMVALAVGLVLSLVITGSVLTMGRQFRVVSSNVAAQTGAQVALSLIDQTARTAGSGLFANGSTMCPTFNAWKDGSVKSNGAVLAPLRIVNGGSAGASDTIVFSGVAGGGVMASSPVITSTTTGAATVVVGNAGGFASGDLALLAAPGSGSPCLLFQVTAAPVANGTACGGNAALCTTLTRGVNGATGYNPGPGTFGTQPTYGFAADGSTAPPTVGPAVVQRVGSEFVQTAFRVMCNTLVQYNAFTDNPSCTEGPLSFTGGANALVADVVLMHAQYGITSAANSDIVTNWVDATGATWAAPTAANAARVKALRIVLVSRAKEAENAVVTDAQCTNGGGVVNTGPCSFDDAEAPAIDLSGVPVVGGKTWRHYRYRVHQAVIPLRNVLWSL